MRKTVGIDPTTGAHCLMEIAETAAEQVELDRRRELAEFQKWRARGQRQWPHHPAFYR